MREFALINSQGTRWNLTTKEFFANNPSGLGISMDNEYVNDGASFKLIKSEVKVDQITLDLIIRKDPYTRFKQFCDFLDHSPLVLEYSTDKDTSARITYRRDVGIKDIPKGELDKWGCLNVALQLDKVTPWYIWIKNELRNSKYDEWTKIYYNMSNAESSTPFYCYPFGYSTFGYWDNITGNVKNDSILLGLYDTTPMRVTVIADKTTGTITKPGWEIRNMNEERLYFMEFNIDLKPGETLIVNSDWFNTEMYTIDSAGKKTDIKNKLSLESDSYIQLPKGNITFMPNSEHLKDIFNEWYGINFLLEYKLERAVV